MTHRELRRLRLGLTGGIGSGKSTAAARFRALGVPVVDADAVSRALTASGGAAMPAIIAAFGPEAADKTGAMNRSRMREWFLTNPKVQAALEAILHPMIAERTKALLDEASKNSPLVVYDCPLLLEKPDWRRAVDEVLVIDLDTATQIERTCARSGLDEATVRGFLAKQLPRRERLAKADHVIYNGLDKAALEERVDLLYNVLTAGQTRPNCFDHDASPGSRP